MQPSSIGASAVGNQIPLTIRVMLHANKSIQIHQRQWWSLREEGGGHPRIFFFRDIIKTIRIIRWLRLDGQWQSIQSPAAKSYPAWPNPTKSYPAWSNPIAAKSYLAWPNPAKSNPAWLNPTAPRSKPAVSVKGRGWWASEDFFFFLRYNQDR